MGIFDKKSIIKIEKEDLNDAKLSSIDFANEMVKKRAFADVLGARLAMKMLFSKKLEVNNVYSLYTIHGVLEELDIADIYLDDVRIDVRLVFNPDEIFVPKSHFETDLLPDLYLVLHLKEDLSCAEALGFFEPKDIDKQNANNDFYFVESNKLKDIDGLKDYLKAFKGKSVNQIPQANFEQAEELFLSLADKEISDEDKRFLFKQLSQSIALREKIVEFENFEIISREVAKNENILQDGMLEFVGAQKVFEDEDANASREEVKAEIIGEVLSDMLDDEISISEVKPSTDEDLDFLSELESASEEAQDVEPESKSEGKILENSVKALTAGLELGTVVAAGSAAAMTASAAAEAEIIKNATELIDAGLELGSDLLKNSTDSDDILSELDFEDISVDDINTDEQEGLSELNFDDMVTDEFVDSKVDESEEIEDATEFDVEDVLESIEEVQELEPVVEEPSFEDIKESVTEIEEEMPAFSGMTPELESFEALPELDFSAEEEKLLSADSDSDELVPLAEIEDQDFVQESLPEVIETMESIDEVSDFSINEELEQEELSEIFDDGTNEESLQEELSEFSDDGTNEELSFDAIKANAEDDFGGIDMSELMAKVGVDSDLLDTDSIVIEGKTPFDDLVVETSSESFDEAQDQTAFENEEFGSDADPDDELMKELEEFDFGDVDEQIPEETTTIEDFETASKQNIKPEIETYQPSFESSLSDDVDNLDSEVDELLKGFESGDRKQALADVLSACDLDEDDLSFLDSEPSKVPQSFEEFSKDYEQDTVSEKETLQMLFKDGEDIDSSEFKEKEILPSISKDKKMVIAASVASVVLVSFVIGGSVMYNNKSGTPVVDNQPQVAAESQVPMPTGDSMGIDSAQQMPQPDMLEQQVIPGEGQPQASSRDMGQAVSDAFLSEPVSANITKVAWEVPEELAYNDSFRKYLQIAGKNLKLNLQNDLLLATEMAYSNRVVIDLVISGNGSLQSVNVVNSSGSKQIDKIVLQSVKETLKYLKIPSSELGGSSASATLIINF